MMSRQKSYMVLMSFITFFGDIHHTAIYAEPVAPVRFPTLNNVETWKQLLSSKPPLPIWARTLARSLPETTAAMIELDYVHRAKNPLNPILRGKLRWIAANTIACEYSTKYAEADLIRAGLTSKELEKFRSGIAHQPKSEQAVLRFAEKITRAAYTITDQEVAELLKQYGPERLVAIVHTLAHANFQDRIFLSLGITVDPDGPYPPRTLQWKKQEKFKSTAPTRPKWKAAQSAKVVSSNQGPDWLDHSFNDVQKAQENQKARQSRIPLPDPSSLSKLPDEQKKRTSRIVWSQTSLGYQPMLTTAWFDCMSTFQAEAKFNRVFSNTFFWVITRSNECFY